MNNNKTRVIWSGKALEPDRIQVLRGCCVASIVSISRYCAQPIGAQEWKRRRDRLYHLLNVLEGDPYYCVPPEKELSDDAIIVCIGETCISEDDANLLAHAVKVYGESNAAVLLTYTGFSAKHSHNLVDDIMDPVRDRVMAQERKNWEECDEPIPNS